MAHIHNAAHSTHNGVPPPYEPITCPACGQGIRFEYVGTQKWPERVAQSMGICAVVQIWRCKDCDTTITLSKNS